MRSLLAPSRRQFMGAGLCLAAASGLPVRAAEARFLPLSIIVYDERHAAARHFAAAARSYPAHAIRGEVQDLWLGVLRPQWRKGAQALAGMTTYDALFLIAMMARDADLHLIYRAHHGVGAAPHPSFGPKATLAQHPDLAGPERQWAGDAACIVTSWPVERTERALAHSTIALADRQALDRKALVTWLLAAPSRG